MGNINKITKKLKNLLLFKKIFWIMTIAIILLCLIYMGNLHYLIKAYDKNLYEVTAKELNISTSTMEEKMKVIERISEEIATNQVIQENLSKLAKPQESDRTGKLKREVYEELYRYFYTSPYVTTISIILDDSEIHMGQEIFWTEDRKEAISVSSEKAEGRAYWEYGEKSKRKVACVRQIRQMEYVTLKPLGIVYIDTDMKNLIRDSLKKTGYEDTGGRFLLYGKDGIVYSENKEDEKECGKFSSEGEKHYSVETVNGIKEFVINGTMWKNEWQYLYFRNYDQLFSQLKWVKVITILSAGICGIIILLIVRRILGGIFKHIDYLLQKIENFGSGKMNEEQAKMQYEGRTDEIGQLHRAFDEMSHSVKVLRDENYEKQILLRDAEIKMLEQQINPHFLYNTLDSINWMAQMHGADEISEMALALASLFRTSISEKRELILLDEELELLNNYIKIQKIRFKDRMEFEIVRLGDIGELYIPKLCIQPLVENALKYALECNDEVCTIQVRIEKVDQYCRIQISNTGSEFAQDLLEKLKNQTVIPQGTGVGIINIDSRLKLIYGNRYGLKFRNEDNRAIVELQIPLKREKEDEKEGDRNVTVNDCR